MTAIDFYTHVSDRHQVVTKLVAKAFAQHGSVRVLTADAASTEALGKLLWLLPATGFLPHCRVGDRLAAETPIWVDHALEHPGVAAVLINLHASPPPFFSRFERMAEIVGVDEDDAAQARSRFRYYRERGYELRTHNLGDSE
ncbi:MAG: DNA polymerase III subunit chi [Betaproteobacteria bacterium]